MNRDMLIKNIRKVLDLNLYEAKVYLSIVAYGPLEKRQIYKKSGIPQSRVYDIIISLKNKGLINSFIKDKHENYKTLDPKNSINAYLNQLKWDHEETLEKEKIKFENKVKILNDVFYKNIKEKQKDSKKLIISLRDIYSKTIPGDDELIQLVKGEQNLVNHISEQVKISSSVIKNLSSPPYLTEALIWENISNKLKEGIKYLHLSYSGLLLEWGIWRIKEDQKVGVSFRFLTKDEIKEKFYIFDNNSCFIRLKDPITNNFSEHGVLIKDINWVTDHNKKFEDLWKKAFSFEELNNRIINKRKEVSKNLNREEVMLLNKILERGKYTTTQDLEIKNIKQILKSLENKKLIVPFKKSILGYITNAKIFLGKEHE